MVDRFLTEISSSVQLTKKDNNLGNFTFQDLFIFGKRLIICQVTCIGKSRYKVRLQFLYSLLLMNTLSHF